MFKVHRIDEPVRAGVVQRHFPFHTGDDEQFHAFVDGDGTATRHLDFGVDLGNKIIFGPFGSHKEVKRLLEQDAQHLVLGQKVPDGGERGARLHVCPFQFAMDGADFALLDRVERLWVAFARDGGDKRSGPFLPCTVRADDLISQLERTERHHTGMGGDDFLFLKRGSLDFFEKACDI